MTNQLKRVQIYLDEENLAVYDDFAKEKKVTRSSVIRDALEKQARKLVRKTSPKNKKTKSILLEMAGMGVSKTGTVGLNIDEIYLED